MGGITCNAEGFAGETGAVDVLEGGERDTVRMHPLAQTAESSGLVEGLMHVRSFKSGFSSNFGLAPCTI